jgi:hypothetical protein
MQPGMSGAAVLEVVEVLLGPEAEIVAVLQAVHLGQQPGDHVAHSSSRNTEARANLAICSSAANLAQDLSFPRRKPEGWRVAELGGIHYFYVTWSYKTRDCGHGIHGPLSPSNVWNCTLLSVCDV